MSLKTYMQKPNATTNQIPHRLPIAGAVTTSTKSTVPLGCRRWRSDKATAAKPKDAGPPSEGPAEGWKDPSNEYASSLDGQRMRAGTINLYPHQHEPNACVFVIEGDAQWLDHHKGSLDLDGKKKRMTV